MLHQIPPPLSLHQPPPFSMHNGPPPPLPPPPPHIAQQMGLPYGQMDPNMISQMRPPPHSTYPMMPPPRPGPHDSSHSMLMSQASGGEMPSQQPGAALTAQQQQQQRLPNQPTGFGHPPDFNQNPFTRGPPPFHPGQAFHHQMPPHANFAPSHGGGEIRYRGQSADRRFKKRRV